jgi:hypothetical protein
VLCALVRAGTGPLPAGHFVQFVCSPALITCGSLHRRHSPLIENVAPTHIMHRSRALFGPSPSLHWVHLAWPWTILGMSQTIPAPKNI